MTITNLFIYLDVCCRHFPKRMGYMLISPMWQWQMLSVNTKNCYREETDLWAEFGRRVPFGKRFSSKHSVKASAV
jgi:hypothetical protein